MNLALRWIMIRLIRMCGSVIPIPSLPPMLRSQPRFTARCRKRFSALSLAAIRILSFEPGRERASAVEAGCRQRRSDARLTRTSVNFGNCTFAEVEFDLRPALPAEGEWHSAVHSAALPALLPARHATSAAEIVFQARPE